MKNWERIKELFNRAVELPEAERAAFLAAAGDDDEVRREVESLLESDGAADSLPDVFVLFDENSGAENSRIIGQRIGNYKIIGELGKGGMGAVFLAEREDFAKQVALKIIKRGLDSKDLVRRFQNERQILAALEHPHIARLLDGGTTPDGLPFFVMELIAGEELLDYCNARNLTVGARLRLFRKICAAVSYAHGKLIVHRDLKPSNILVTNDGEPKLLDFGISKILSADTFDQKGTATALGMMTPNYASPEQFRGETVATATDVYSLGVILYELLTGSLPYNLAHKRVDEIMQIVCETAPDAPSRVFRDAATRRRGDTAKQPNSTKQFTASPRHRVTVSQLKGDLDNIVLKALRKEAARRYSSVEQFSEDIRRHLEGLPVSARADTFSYRAEKFIKRHQTAVFAGLLIFLTLLGGITATTWQAVRAEREKKRAEVRFAEVRQLANNVVFKYHDEIANISGTTKVREMLIKDAVEYLDRLSQEAADDTALKDELAVSYLRIGNLQGGLHGSSGLGETAESLASIQKAVALLEDAAQKSADTNILNHLHSAYSDFGAALTRAGDKENLAYIQKAAALNEKLLQAEPDNSVRLNALAADYISLADITPDEELSGDNKSNIYNGNTALYRKALATVEQVLASDPANEKALQYRMQAASRIGSGYHIAADKLSGNDEKKARMLDLARTAAVFEQTASETVKQLLLTNPQDADWKFNLLQLEWNESLTQVLLGEKETALQTQGAVIESVSAVARNDPSSSDTQHTLAGMLDGYSSTYASLKNYEAAFRYQRQALATINALVEKDPQNLEFRQTRRDILIHGADYTEMRGDYEEAVELYRTAFEQYKEAPMLKDNPTAVLYDEGVMYGKIGDADLDAAEKLKSAPRSAKLREAAAAYRKNLEIWQQPAVADEYFIDNQEQIEAVRQKLRKCGAQTASL